jgi:hypothetical protein
MNAVTVMSAGGSLIRAQRQIQAALDDTHMMAVKSILFCPDHAERAEFEH